ncbi:MAG: protein-glutamate O-methyltransferase CheR [Candidatus Heimdallarchaeota archaeon]|nr:protein-glutamate O-methyltransferase CheR [Candidatus Heimdallarchaeota archaeon]
MVEQDKKKVARGATLYSDKTKKVRNSPEDNEIRNRVRKRIREMNSEPLSTIIKPVKDEKYKKQVIEFLGRHGIEVTSYKERYITRRVKVRLGRLRLSSYKDYLLYLQSNPQEIRSVKESLSINVTRFFRNRDTFDLIKEKMFPEMLNRAKETSKLELKLWSAGCAVGAEPYSLAILAADSIASQIKVNILATDVKNELISIAKSGVYNEQYLAEMDKIEVTKNFKKISEENFELLNSIKKLVTFRQHDLMKDSYPSNLDMIVCRNVLIYVDRDTQLEIVKKFFDALRPGGILVLGRTETLFGDWRKDVDILSTKHRIYQKKAGLGSSYKMQIEDKREKFTEKISRKRSAPISKRSTLKSQITTQDSRLEELRDFRKTFEERKAIWDLQIEEQEKTVGERSIKSHPRTFRSVSSSIDRSKLKTKTTSSLKEDTSKTKRIPSGKLTGEKFKAGLKPRTDKGILSNYRSMLVKTKNPVRTASVRRDKKKENNLEFNYKQTPEEIYRTLMKKKRQREARKY